MLSDTRMNGTLHQGEAWRATRMAEAVDVFEDVFLNGLTAHNKDELAHKARETANTPTLAW